MDWCFAPGAWDMALAAGLVAACGAVAGVRAWLRTRPRPAPGKGVKRGPPPSQFRRGLGALCALAVVACAWTYARAGSVRIEAPVRLEVAAGSRAARRAEAAACRCASPACLRSALGGRAAGALFRVPHFWLGGGQKCGTTSMYDLLSRHPQLVPPTPKEPGYFALPWPGRAARARWYARDVLRLPALCDRGLARAATFDATASPSRPRRPRARSSRESLRRYYLQWGAPAARALRAAAPWTRVVLLFREPIGRAISWLQHMALKFPRVPNCLHYRAIDCCVRKRWFLAGNHHLGGSRYHEHLRAWLASGWSLDDFHVVRFEDLFLRDGLATVYSGILDFLGLDGAPARNLTEAETRPSNRRSVRPYNISTDAYRAMVAAVDDDARPRRRAPSFSSEGRTRAPPAPQVAALEALLGRDFGWAATWRRQLAQCEADGICRVSLIPAANPPGR